MQSAIEKKAELMLSLAEKIYATVIAVVLGAPVINMFDTNKNTIIGLSSLQYYLLLVIAGVLGAIFLQWKALKIFRVLEVVESVADKPN